MSLLSMLNSRHVSAMVSPVHLIQSSGNDDKIFACQFLIRMMRLTGKRLLALWNDKVEEWIRLLQTQLK
jgi:hypothetical protein